MNSSETPGEPLNILMLVDSLGIGGQKPTFWLSLRSSLSASTT